MRAAIDRLYFFAVVCANAEVFGRVFGGHATLSANSTASAFSSGSSDPVLLAINAVISFATMSLAFSKLPQILAMLGQVKLLLVLYLLAAISIIWSVDRASTFRTGVYFFLYLTSAAYISLRFENQEIVRLVGDFMVTLALLSIPGQYLLPQNVFFLNDWSGIFLQKNELGAAMAIGVVALIASRGPWNLFRIGAVALCVDLLLLSHAFTALVATLTAVGILVYMRANQHLRLLLLSSIIGGSLILSFAVSSISGAFSSTTGKDLTFTGRTEVWALVVKKIMERPLLGYGNSAFWSAEAESINQFINWQPGQAHNGYLEICLNLGVAGLVLTLLILQNGLRRARRLRRFYGHDAGVWMLLVTVVLLVHNCAESDFMKMTILWFIFLITYLSCWRLENSLFAELATDGSSAEGEQYTVNALTS